MDDWKWHPLATNIRLVTFNYWLLPCSLMTCRWNNVFRRLVIHLWLKGRKCWILMRKQHIVAIQRHRQDSELFLWRSGSWSVMPFEQVDCGFLIGNPQWECKVHFLSRNAGRVHMITRILTRRPSILSTTWNLMISDPKTRWPQTPTFGKDWSMTRNQLTSEQTSDKHTAS